MDLLDVKTDFDIENIFASSEIVNPQSTRVCKVICQISDFLTDSECVYLINQIRYQNLSHQYNSEQRDSTCLIPMDIY